MTGGAAPSVLGSGYRHVHDNLRRHPWIHELDRAPSWSAQAGAGAARLTQSRPRPGSLTARKPESESLVPILLGGSREGAAGSTGRMVTLVAPAISAKYLNSRGVPPHCRLS